MRRCASRAREGRQRLAEAQIADAHVDQELQAAPDAGASLPRILDRREEAEGVGDGHLQQVMDGAAVVGQLQHVVPVRPAFTDLAVQAHVVEERQLDLQEAPALAFRAGAPSVEAEQRGRDLVRRGERPPDGIEHAE